MRCRIVKCFIPLEDSDESSVVFSSLEIPLRDGMSVYETVDAFERQFKDFSIQEDSSYDNNKHNNEKINNINKNKEMNHTNQINNINENKKINEDNKINNHIKIKNKIELRSVINLHNKEGVKDLAQVRNMVEQIKNKKDIFSESGIPNIKMVMDDNGELVLFDGHHSFLAYIACGREYLHEVPHLIVENEDVENQDVENEGLGDEKAGCVAEETGCVSDAEILVFFGKHAGKIKDSQWKEYVINWQAGEEEQLCKRVQRNMGELFDSLSGAFE